MWFLMAELLQLAKPRVWTPPGSTLSKGRKLQIHLASKHGGGGGGASARGQKSEPRQLEEKIWKFNLKAILGGSSEGNPSSREARKAGSTVQE